VKEGQLFALVARFAEHNGVLGPRVYNDTVSTPWVMIKLHGLSPQANYTDRATAAVGEVVPTFAGRGCYVVSATDSWAVIANLYSVQPVM
jgi:hypothetical protein